MKKLIAVFALCLAVGGASFGAEHILLQSCEGYGEENRQGLRGSCCSVIEK
jgi:hypothetical protein